MLHIIQNDPEVPPGNLTENLTQLGVLFRLHHPYRAEPLPEQSAISAMIVLGGAMGPMMTPAIHFLTPLKN
jgi:hypothetical protein